MVRVSFKLGPYGPPNRSLPLDTIWVFQFHINKARLVGCRLITGEFEGVHALVAKSRQAPKCEYASGLLGHLMEQFLKLC